MEKYCWPEEMSTEGCHYYTQCQGAAAAADSALNEELGGSSSSYNFYQLPPYNWFPHDSSSCQFINGSTYFEEEDRSTSANASKSRSHSQAEKRRRDRINAQLATLRKFIPKSDKMDKAALLGCVVEHLKELKTKTSEVSKHNITIPTEIDQVTVIDCHSDTSCTSNDHVIFIRVLICCDDRPELLTELNHAIESIRLRMVEADMSCLGGRIICSFMVCSKDGNDQRFNGDINNIKQSLKAVLSRIVASSSSSSNNRIKSKRQRFFFHS